MINTDRIEQARMSLTQAVTRSQAAANAHDPDGRATEEHVLAAELRLRRGGREDLGHRLADVLDGDVTRAESRREMRQIISKIDAELEPSVSTKRSFRRASDGGVGQ